METTKNRLENLVEVGNKARREVEDYLNRWLNDSSKGWAVRPDSVNRSKKKFSAPLAVVSIRG